MAECFAYCSDDDVGACEETACYTELISCIAEAIKSKQKETHVIKGKESFLTLDVIRDHVVGLLLLLIELDVPSQVLNFLYTNQVLWGWAKRPYLCCNIRHY